MKRAYLTLIAICSLFFLFGCAQPAKILNLNTTSPSNAKKIESAVVTVSPSIYTNGKFVNSRLVIDSIKNEIKKTFFEKNIPVEIVEITGVELNSNELTAATKKLNPSHLLYVQTTSGSTIQGTLSSVVWQVSLSQKRELTQAEKAKLKAQNISDPAFVYEPVYKALFSANSCTVMASFNDDFRINCVQKLTIPLSQSLTSSGY